MPNLFSLIGSSWDFCRRQPTVLQSALWFLFLPSVLGNLLSDYQLMHLDELQGRREILAVLVLGQIALALICVWGTACVLSVGKRVLQAKAGRTRTSFKTVRQQASGSFIPLLLTGILRTIVTILWGLLLIVPGIVYFFRTAFYPVVVVCEGMAYRPALRQCLDISRGRFWPVTGTVLGLGLLTLLPAQILAGILSFIAKDLGLPALIASTVASGIFFTFALVIYLIAMVGAYEYFKPKAYVRN
jgi:hypothetical protein